MQVFDFFTVLFCVCLFVQQPPLFACGNTCYDCFKRVTGVMVTSVEYQFTQAVNFGGPFLNVKDHEFKTVFRNFVSLLCNNTSPSNYKFVQN